MEYISKQSLLADLNETTPHSYFAFETMVRAYPTEDVAPVIHAHWEIIYESSAGVTDSKCSNCGYESIAYENDVHTDKDCHYCPCCGAKMDEEVEDAKIYKHR